MGTSEHRYSPGSLPGQGGGGGGVVQPTQRPPNQGIGIRPIGGGVPLVSVPKPDLDVPASAPPATERPKIQTFGQGLTGGHHQEAWKRPTNLTGSGATHIRSFHCKLTGDSLENLDRQINEWLDSHPDYEVKLVNTTVGEWTGKLKEPNLIVQVWV